MAVYCWVDEQASINKKESRLVVVLVLGPNEKRCAQIISSKNVSKCEAAFPPLIRCVPSVPSATPTPPALASQASE